MKISRNSQNGFTLIELVFVVLLIVLLSAVAIPKASSVLGLNLRSSATEVRDFVHAAHEHAILRHERLRITFDFENRMYFAEVYEPPPPPELIASDAKLDDVINQFEDALEEFGSFADDEEERAKKEAMLFQKLETSTLKGVTLPDGVSIKQVYLVGQDKVIQEGKASIEYAPNGFTDKVIIQLMGARENVFSIVVSPVGGGAHVFRGELGPDEA